MKLIFFALTALLPCVVLAQVAADSSGGFGSVQAAPTSPTAPTPAGNPQKQLSYLTKKLNLDETEQGEIGPVLTTRETQKKTILADGTLSDDQRRGQIRTLMESTDQEIESYLTADQETAYEALQHPGKAAPTSTAEVPPDP